MLENDRNSSIFINGKEKVIEMLRLLNPEERLRILKSLELKNPSLALELESESQSFNVLAELNDEKLQILMNHLPAPVMGLAIKRADLSLQRRLLSLAPRAYAEKAYEVFSKDLSNLHENIDKAQRKVLETFALLKKERKV